jgi:hypothetical protein
MKWNLEIREEGRIWSQHGEILPQKYSNINIKTLDELIPISVY